MASLLNAFKKKTDPVEEAKQVRTLCTKVLILSFYLHNSTHTYTHTLTLLYINTHTQWKRNIGREVRTIDRTLMDIEREEKKLIKEIQKLAKEGDSRKGALQILAKDLVRSRKTREKMVNGKAMLSSVQVCM